MHGEGEDDKGVMVLQQNGILSINQWQRFRQQQIRFCNNSTVILGNIYNVTSGRNSTVIVRYHCGGWPEEVNTCFLNSYMVYL